MKPHTKKALDYSKIQLALRLERAEQELSMAYRKLSNVRHVLNYPEDWDAEQFPGIWSALNEVKRKADLFSAVNQKNESLIDSLHQLAHALQFAKDNPPTSEGQQEISMMHSDETAIEFIYRKITEVSSIGE